MGDVAVALTASLGIAWELVEALSDVVVGTDMSLGVRDSLLDLAGDLVGAMLGGVLVLAIERRRSGRVSRRGAGRR